MTQQTTQNETNPQVEELIALCESAGGPAPNLEKISDWILNLTAAMDLAARVAENGPKVVQVPADGLLICPVSTASRYFGEGLKTGISAMLLAIVAGDLRGLEMARDGWPVCIEALHEEWQSAEAAAELLHRPCEGLES